MNGEEIRHSKAARGFGIRDGNGIVFVSSTGDICPAGFLPQTAGNVRTHRLADVYRTALSVQTPARPAFVRRPLRSLRIPLALRGIARARVLGHRGSTGIGIRLCGAGFRGTRANPAPGVCGRNSQTQGASTEPIHQLEAACETGAIRGLNRSSMRSASSRRSPAALISFGLSAASRLRMRGGTLPNRFSIWLSSISICPSANPSAKPSANPSARPCRISGPITP